MSVNFKPKRTAFLLTTDTPFPCVPADFNNGNSVPMPSASKWAQVRPPKTIKASSHVHLKYINEIIDTVKQLQTHNWICSCCPWLCGINTLEMVQKNDYRCTTSVKKLLEDLGWPSLTDRCKDARLTLFAKAVSGHSAISVCHLSRPTRFSRNVNESSFIPISARTDVYKYSFFPHTDNDWKFLPATTRVSLLPPIDKSPVLSCWAMIPHQWHS